MVPLELHQQGGDVSAHVLEDLPIELLRRTAMMMKDDGRRLVAAREPGREDAVPHLRISAASCRANVEPGARLLLVAHPGKRANDIARIAVARSVVHDDDLVRCV